MILLTKPFAAICLELLTSTVLPYSAYEGSDDDCNENHPNESRIMFENYSSGAVNHSTSTTGNTLWPDSKDQFKATALIRARKSYLHKSISRLSHQRIPHLSRPLYLLQRQFRH